MELFFFPLRLVFLILDIEGLSELPVEGEPVSLRVSLGFWIKSGVTLCLPNLHGVIWKGKKKQLIRSKFSRKFYFYFITGRGVSFSCRGYKLVL